MVAPTAQSVIRYQKGVLHHFATLPLTEGVFPIPLCQHIVVLSEQGEPKDLRNTRFSAGKTVASPKSTHDFHIYPNSLL